MNRRWKAADVPDGLFLVYVDYAQHERQKEWGTEWRRTGDLPWAHRYDLERMLPVPWKVLLAKAKRVIDRGLMTGCACGCRGGYELTAAGRETVERWWAR